MGKPGGGRTGDLITDSFCNGLSKKDGARSTSFDSLGGSKLGATSESLSPVNGLKRNLSGLISITGGVPDTVGTDCEAMVSTVVPLTDGTGDEVT